MNRLSRLILAAAVFSPLGMAQSKYVNDVLALNPIGYWRLDGNANDATSQGNNGTLMNGVTFTGPGLGAPIGDPNDQAAVFNIAQNQYISIPSTASGTLFALDWFHPFTMMIWAKTGYLSSNMILFAKEENSGNYRGPYLVIDNGSAGSPGPGGAGRFALILQATPSNGTAGSGNDLWVETLASVNDGAWHFLVATYDGSGQASGIQLYVDGTAVATAKYTNTLNGLTTLNNVPVTIGSRDTGAVPYSGLLDEAAIFGTALAATQVRQLQNDAGLTVQQILPQFAFGGGWYSALYFTNTSSSPVSFPVSFTDDNAAPLTVPSVGGSSTTVSLAAGGTAIIEAPNSGPLNQGYVSVSLPSGVVGYGVFRQSVPGIADQEAVVPLSAVSATSATLIWDDTNYTTAVAMVNPSVVPTTVAITVLDSSGNILGTSSVALLAKSKTETVLRGLPGLGAMAGTRGSAKFTVATGNVAVLGLRFYGAAFTSIPTVGQ
jgi:hypothetical protein